MVILIMMLVMRMILKVKIMIRPQVAENSLPVKGQASSFKENV